MSDVWCHGIYPREAVHLALGFLERGVMIQFCGAVRVRYHFRFVFLWVQNIGDGINDELRIHSGKTLLILACPTFGVTESTLSEQCTWLQVF